MGRIDNNDSQVDKIYDVEEQKRNDRRRNRHFNNIRKPTSPPPAPPISSSQNRRVPPRQNSSEQKVDQQSEFDNEIYSDEDEDDLEYGVSQISDDDSDDMERKPKSINSTLSFINSAKMLLSTRTLKKNNVNEHVHENNVNPKLFETIQNPIINPQEGGKTIIKTGKLSINSEGKQVLEITEPKEEKKQNLFVKKSFCKCCSYFHLPDEKQNLKYEDSLIKVVRALLAQGEMFTYSIDFITFFTVLNFAFALVGLCSETDGYFVAYSNTLERSSTFINVFIGWDRYMINFNGGNTATVRYISDISESAYFFGCLTFLGLLYSLWLSIFLSWILFSIYRNYEILPMFTVLKYRYFEFISRSSLVVSFYLFLFGMLCYCVLIPQEFERAFSAAGYDNFLVQTSYGYCLLTLLTLSQFFMGIFLSFYAKKLDNLIEESAISIRQQKKIEYDRLLLLKEEEEKKKTKKKKKDKSKSSKSPKSKEEDNVPQTDQTEGSNSNIPTATTVDNLTGSVSV